MAKIGKSIELNSGNKIPVIGLGSWNAKGFPLQNAILTAVKEGYRHIDTAYVYENEVDVGKALKRIFKSGECTRDEIFVTTKLWNTFHRADLVRSACRQSLERLQLDYIDLYLMHTPCAYKEGTNELRPRDESQNVIFSNAVFEDTWRQMKKLQQEGLVKDIGISNFNIKQMQRILATGITPSVLQIESHPFLVQNDVEQFCRENSIHITGFSPLGSPSRPIVFTGEPILLANETVAGIARSHNKTSAQVLIRYQLQKGHSTIPKSEQAAHIRENYNVFDFVLSDSEIKILDDLSYCRRFVPFVE